ncbi:hypothetical protein [Serratia rubidaea]|uniref:hypothetical protein n=1 Tax=Serratia rubidaea TaxID=61652 RepID=UPI003FA385D9
MDTKKIDRYSVTITLILLSISAIFSYFLGGKLVGNTDALNLAANIFSVLTGFLLLVITMTSDTASILKGLPNSEKENQKTRFEIRFSKYYALFVSYFLVLFMIFLYYLISKDPHPTSKVYDYFKLFLEYGIAFLAPYSFLSSLFIPLRIKELFLERFKLNSQE